MQIQTDVIGFKKSLSQASPIPMTTEPACLKPCPKVTKVSSIASELNESGSFRPCVVSAGSFRPGSFRPIFGLGRFGLSR